MALQKRSSIALNNICRYCRGAGRQTAQEYKGDHGEERVELHHE